MVWTKEKRKITSTKATQLNIDNYSAEHESQASGKNEVQFSIKCHDFHHRDI